MNAADRFRRMALARPLVALGLALLVMLLGAIAVQTWRLQRALDAGEQNGLRADSLAAVVDTTRVTVLRERDRARILGDSLQAVERRGVQVTDPARDDFDRATGRSSVARGGISVTPDRIITTSTSGLSTVDSTDVRRAEFRIDSSAAVASPRFTAEAAVTMPAPPAAAELALDVQLMPIVLRPRVQCGAPDPAGIRPATMAVVGPLGYDLEVLPLDVDVRACNPDFGRPKGMRVGLGTVGFVALVAAAMGAWAAR